MDCIGAGSSQIIAYADLAVNFAGFFGTIGIITGWLLSESSTEIVPSDYQTH